MRFATALTPEMTRFREQLAGQAPLNSRNPASASSFSGYGGGNLAGRVAEYLYDELVKRRLPESPSLSGSEQARLSRVGHHSFMYHAADSNLGFRKSAISGTSGFHFNLKPHEPLRPASRSFSYHYRLSSRDRQLTSTQPIMRAYIVLSRAHAERVPELFVDLVSRLRKAGVEFDAKASTPDMVMGRLDNMVFYVSGEHQPQARNVIVEFLKHHGVGSEYNLLPAIKGSASGLFWAPEPDDEEKKIASRIRGGLPKASYHEMVSLAVAPFYMNRLADAHERRGNHLEAETFRREAHRVERILQGYSESLSR